MPAVSLFTDFCESELGLDLEDIEPEEVRVLCEGPVFRTIAAYCAGKRSERPARADDALYDHDELGVDPEEDCEHA